ncbi:hypothetical protein [Spiroplasma endosymbiont of Atherix ibis]|uniref:hypothetical protein n=1 Tax=Spiroplasma endosymbiont of Atherix ibis TaxID=3066291 RepID=UPI0030CC4E1E
MKRYDWDIPSIIDELTEENKKEILERWIKEQRDKKDKESLNSYKTLKKSLKSKILMLHRTTFYKQKIIRKYKYDYLKPIITKIFIKNKWIYGSGKLLIILATNNIYINERTLRHYMFRWGLVTLIRKKKRKSEYKNT